MRSNIGKDQINLGLISGGPASDNGPHDLQHRGDSGTTGDHSEVPNHVGSVSESTLGAADTDGLAHNERSHVLGDVALGVGLDEDVKVARLVVTRHRSVRADNFLGGAIRLGKLSTDGDVLADGEAEDGRGVIELEAVAGYKADELESNIAVAEGIGRGNSQAGDLHGNIVGDDSLLLELKLLEDVGLQDLLDLCDSECQLAFPLKDLKRQRGRKLLTQGIEVVDAKGKGQERRVGHPIALDNEGAEDEQRSGDIDVVNVLALEQRSVVGGHGLRESGSSPPRPIWRAFSKQDLWAPGKRLQGAEAGAMTTRSRPEVVSRSRRESKGGKSACCTT